MDVQVCDADQRLGDTQGGKERKKGGETHTHTHRHTQRDRQCLCAEPQKEWGLWKERAVIKVEMRRWRRKGGRHWGEWEVQSQPQGLCAHSNFIVWCTIFIGMLFFHERVRLFAWNMHAPARPHRHQTVTTFHTSFASGACEGSSTAIKDVVTLRLTASPCYTDRGIAAFKKPSTDVADTTSPFCISPFAGLAWLMNGRQWRPKRANSRKV